GRRSGRRGVLRRRAGEGDHARLAPALPAGTRPRQTTRDAAGVTARGAAVGPVGGPRRWAVDGRPGGPSVGPGGSSTQRAWMAGAGGSAMPAPMWKLGWGGWL